MDSNWSSVELKEQIKTLLHWTVAQAAECLLWKGEALSLNPSPTKKRKKRKENRSLL
jgi:hypothetical protein